MRIFQVLLSLGLLASPALAQICGSPVTLRSEKGAALSHAELDGNLTRVRELCNANLDQAGDARPPLAHSHAAEQVPIADPGAYFAVDWVEDALQQLGDQVDRRQVWTVCSSGCSHTSVSAALADVAVTPIEVDTLNVVRVVEIQDREILATNPLVLPESTIVTCHDRSLVALQSSNTAGCKILFVPSLAAGPSSGDLVSMGRHTALTDLEIYFAGALTGPLNLVKYVGGGATSYGTLLNTKFRAQASSVTAGTPLNLLLAETVGGFQYLTWRDLDLHPVTSSGNDFVTLLSAKGTALGYGDGGWFRSNSLSPGRGVHAQDSAKIHLYDTLVGVEGGGGDFSIAALQADPAASIWTNGEPVSSALGKVTWGQRIRSWMSMSFPDSGDSSPVVAEINPTSEVCFLDCQDTEGCDLSIGETAARQGQSVRLINSGANDVRIAQIGGQVINSGGAELSLTPSFPSAEWVYDGTVWQGGTPVPSTGGGGGGSGVSGTGTSGSFATWSGSTSLADSILSVIAGDLVQASGKLVLPMGSGLGLRFGDGDSGIYENSDDFLYWGSGATVLMRGSHNAFGSPSIQFGTGNHTPQVMVETGSATNPVFSGRNDFSSGMSVLAGEVNLIASGGNKLQATVGGVALTDLFRLIPDTTLPTCEPSAAGGIQHDATGPALCWCDGAAWQVLAGTGPCS